MRLYPSSVVFAFCFICLAYLLLRVLNRRPPPIIRRWKRPNRTSRNDEIRDMIAQNLRQQDDKQLLRLIRDKFVMRPAFYLSDGSNHLHPAVHTRTAKIVHDILGHKREGYFIEYIDRNSAKPSNTAWLEKQLGWTGIILHRDPLFQRRPYARNRRCLNANVCPLVRSELISNRTLATPRNESTRSARFDDDRYCFDIYSILLAINLTEVDYLSLELDTSQDPVLQLLPLDRLNISVISIGYRNANYTESFTEYFESQDYSLHSIVIRTEETIDGNTMIDEYKSNILIFLGSSFFDTNSSES